MSAVWVPVLASMKGFIGEVNKGAGQASKQAAQTLEKDLGKAGAAGGKSAGDALAKEMGAASSKVAAARKKEAGASSDLRVAEEQLAQLREKGNASAGQIMAAESKVEDARRRQESMSDRLGAAERDLQSVRDGGEARASAVVTAENRVEDARLKAEKATDQVAVAEQKADDARQASESAAGRVESAEKALAAAKEQAGEGSKEATSAERDLERARKDADAASVSVEKAEGAVGRARADSKTTTEGLEVAELQLTAAQEKTARAAETAGDAAADAARDIGGLGDEMEGADPKASGLAGGLGSLAKNAGLAAAGFVGVRGIGDMISSGFDKVTAIEDTTASLGILMGSASDATAFMDEMTEANMKTPYSFDAWSEAGKNLVAFGMDADDVTDTVMALGEAASASGKGEAALSSMANAFGKAQASGKISMDTINSLAEGGVNGLTILGNHFGESTADMQKMISAGTVPLDEAFDALTTGIMEGSEGAAGSTDSMAGVMDEMSQTTSGQLGLLKMSFVNLGGDIVKLLMPAIQGLIDIGLALVGWVRDMVSDFKEGEGVMGAFRNVIESMMPVLKPLAAVIGGIGAAWLVWTGAIKAWQTVTKIATGIQAAFNAVMAANPITLVALAIAGLVGGLVYFFTQTEKGKEVWDTLVDAFSTAWTWIKDTFGPVFEWIGDVAVSAWDSIKSGWDSLWQGIQTAWNSVLKPVFDMIWTVVSTTLGVIGTIILAPLLLAWEALSWGIQAAWNNIIKPAWDAVASAAQWLWETVLQPVFGFISAAWDRLGNGLRKIYDTIIKPAFDAVGSALKTVWESVIQPVINFIQDKWDGLGTGIRAVYDKVISPAFDALKNGVDKVKSFFSSTVDGIKTVWDKLKGYLAKPINFMIGTVYNDGILKAWNIIAGFIPGLKTAEPAQKIPEHATGGAIRGPGTGTSDDVLMWGSNGEHMLTAAEVQSLGGQGVVYAMRSMIDQGQAFTVDGEGGLVGLPNRTGNDAGDLAGAAPGLFLPAFKKGGEVRPLWEDKVVAGHQYAMKVAPGPYVFGGSSGGVPGGGTDCSGFMSEIADVILGGPGGSRKWATGNFPGPQAGAWAPGLGQGFSVGIINGGPGGGHTAGTLSAAGQHSSVNVESGGGTGQGATYGGAAVGADHGQFTERHHLKIGADGDFESAGSVSPEKKKGVVRDKVKEIFDDLLKPIDGMFADKVGSAPPEWFNIPPDAMHSTKDRTVDWLFDRIEDLGNLLGKAYDGAKKVTGAIADAGSWLWDNTGGRLFDTGGMLPSGGVAVNRSGKPERILSPSQTEDFEELLRMLASGAYDPVREAEDIARAAAGHGNDAWREGTSIAAQVFAEEMGGTPQDIASGALLEFLGISDSLVAKYATTPQSEWAPTPSWYDDGSSAGIASAGTTVQETPPVEEYVTPDMVEPAPSVEIRSLAVDLDEIDPDRHKTPSGPSGYVHGIVSSAQSHGLPPAGARIGVATALVEAGDPMKMWANHAVPESLNFPHDAVGSDHDSVGLFQQRDNGAWGTVADRMDPERSADMFFDAMLSKFPGWASMDPGAVAQGVQVSAFPDKYGTKMGRAEQLVLEAGLYDTGGMFPNGSLAVNLSGKPEHIFTDQAMAHFVESSEALRDAATDLQNVAEAQAPTMFTGPTVDAPTATRSGDDAGQVTVVVNLDGNQVLEKRVDTVEGRVEIHEKEIRKIKGARTSANTAVKLLA